jgi:AraC-like DNA-binding protein
VASNAHAAVVVQYFRQQKSKKQGCTQSLLSQINRLKAEKKRAQHRLLFAVSIILLLLSLALMAWIHYSRWLMQKNKVALEEAGAEKALRELYTPPTLRRMMLSEMDEEERQELLMLRLRDWLLEEKHFANIDKFSVDDVAFALQTNRTYLYEAVKSTTGKTLLEYLRDMQLEEAIRLLEEDNNLKMEAVAFECGMTRATFFRLFKRKYKLSPMQYREMALLMQAERCQIQTSQNETP